MYQNFNFSFEEFQHGRLGKLSTPHGAVDTPAFIFCGTKANVKSITPAQLLEANTQIILSNTYHLMLQPGGEIVQKLGGLHKFMNWNGPILTDSGGFQIFSLGHGSVADEIKGRRSNIRNSNNATKITEEGAVFKSYINGNKYLLTPEKSIEIQHQLGPDLVVVLDECTPFHVDKNYTKKSMELSHRWALRSFAKFQELDNGTQALYGIIQGGVYEDLRSDSTDFVNNQSFFGHAIGGSLGADKVQMQEIVSYTAQKLDKSRPIHLLGIGNIADIFYGVRLGIDTFDCVHPTRIARHGGALVPAALREAENSREHINLINSRYREDNTPIDSDCYCYTCQNFSKGYLHHLLKAKEILATTLITIHNVFFMNRLMQHIREGIRRNDLKVVERQYLSSD